MSRERGAAEPGPDPRVLKRGHGLRESSSSPALPSEEWYKPNCTIVSAALLTVLCGAAKPEGIPHEIINRKIVPVSVSGLRVVFFFGKIENTLPWHCPWHPLKHPCLVSFPGLLPPAPPSVSPTLLSLPLQPGSAKSAPQCGLPASFLPGAQVQDRWALPSSWPWAQLPASTIGAADLLAHRPRARRNPTLLSEPFNICVLILVSFIHSFTQQIFTLYLLYIKHCTRHQGYSREQKRQSPCPQEAYVPHIHL